MAVNETKLQGISYALRKDREARSYDNRSPIRDDALADVEFVREALLEAGLVSPPLIRAGWSDKYGQVYVERIGNTGFPDANEPVALMRAQDRLTHRLMVYYHALSAEAHVPSAQMESVERQVHGFINWQEANRDKVRTPGATGKE
jgi:hypothetical protein